MDTKAKEGTDMYAEFSDYLVTGDEMIDSQHKELIAKINDLLANCEKGRGKVSATQTLGYLMDYTEFHFAAEEKLQEEIGYPGLEEHKMKHADFCKVVSELQEMLEDQEGPTEEFVEKVQEHVVQWLYKHIQGFDRSVAEYKNMVHNNNRL